MSEMLSEIGRRVVSQGRRVVEFVPWRNKTRWLNTILDCEGSGDGHSVA